MAHCQALNITADEASLTHTCHCALQCAAQRCCAGQPPQQHSPTQAALLLTAWCHAQATQRNPIPPPGRASAATQQRSWRQASESLVYTAGLLCCPLPPGVGALHLGAELGPTRVMTSHGKGGPVLPMHRCDWRGANMHCHRVARQAFAKVSPRRCAGERCVIGTACTEPAAAAGRALCPARALPGWLALCLGLGWGGEGGPRQN